MRSHCHQKVIPRDQWCPMSLPRYSQPPIEQLSPPGHASLPGIAPSDLPTTSAPGFVLPPLLSPPYAAFRLQRVVARCRAPPPTLGYASPDRCFDVQPAPAPASARRSYCEPCRGPLRVRRFGRRRSCSIVPMIAFVHESLPYRSLCRLAGHGAHVCSFTSVFRRSKSWQGRQLRRRTLIACPTD